MEKIFKIKNGDLSDGYHTIPHDTTRLMNSMITVMKFKTKPVVKEAKQWDGDWFEMKEWANSVSDGNGTHLSFMFDKKLKCITLEGSMTVELLDWVICGVEGEFYPCKPDIFAKTYEPIPEMPKEEKGGIFPPEMPGEP